MNWANHQSCYRCWLGKEYRGSGKGWGSPGKSQHSPSQSQPLSSEPSQADTQAMEKKAATVAAKEQKASLNALYSALKSLPKESTIKAVVDARNELQKQIQSVRDGMRDSKPVRLRITATENYIAKQAAQLAKVEMELEKLAEERQKLKTLISEKTEHLNQLKDEAGDEDEEAEDVGDEQLAELLSIVLTSSPNRRAKQLAESVLKRMGREDEEDSSDEMDREMYGPMCGLVAIGDPYGGATAATEAAAQANQPEAAAPTSPVKESNAKKLAASLTATLVKQKIEKIESTGKAKTATRGVLSGFGRSFPGRKQSPKEEVDELGFVAAGVEVEDY
jgi:hypothetical protein